MGWCVVGTSVSRLCALARAKRIFGTDKNLRTKNAVMQLPRNDCHIRANVFVILVAASSSAKVNTKHGVGGLYKIVACARMCFSSVRKRRSARTGFSSAQVLPKPARCARQPSFLNG